jgi:hypothetical protein
MYATPSSLLSPSPDRSHRCIALDFLQVDYEELDEIDMTQGRVCYAPILVFYVTDG